VTQHRGHSIARSREARLEPEHKSIQLRMLDGSRTRIPLSPRGTTTHLVTWYGSMFPPPPSHSPQPSAWIHSHPRTRIGQASHIRADPNERAILTRGCTRLLSSLLRRVSCLGLLHEVCPVSGLSRDLLCRRDWSDHVARSFRTNSRLACESGARCGLIVRVHGGKGRPESE
jgi:hypothetical protein